ncbi:hypothetical protein LTR94_028686, partial [Friedmanniomyces endolithicus]
MMAQKQAYNEASRFACSTCEASIEIDSWQKALRPLRDTYSEWGNLIAGWTVGRTIDWRGQHLDGRITVVSEVPVGGFNCRQVRHRISTRERTPRRVLMGHLSLIAAVVLGIAVTTSTPLRAEDVRAGIGRSKSEPVGELFTLPEGVTIGEPIGAYIEDHCFPEDQDEQLREGHGANIRMCVGFTNTLPTAVTVRLPAGLIFVSFDTRSQNGLLIQTETFEVPPGD